MNKLAFCFFLKTYKKDFESAKRLIASWEMYNEDGIELFVLCPEEDVTLFSELTKKGITILSEKQINTPIFEEDSVLSKGYLNQEIYKLAFWELGLCDNYQCLDSDALFIRPFYMKDFMYDSTTPYTTLVQDCDLMSDCYYRSSYWDARQKSIAKIEDALDYHPYKLLTCHGFQNFSSEVLRSFKEEFLIPRGYTYKDVISISPYEFSWYNLWLQKSEKITIKPIEPNFKTIHICQQHIFEVLRGMKLEDWAKGYVGIIVNSNFGINEARYEDVSVYNYNNSGLSEDIIRKNFNFYRRLLRESYRSFPKRLLRRLKKGIKTFVGSRNDRGHDHVR